MRQVKWLFSVLLLTSITAQAQKEYLWVVQFTTNMASISTTNIAPPIEIIEEVVNVVDASNKLAELKADVDFLADPPPEGAAFDADHHTHTHKGEYWTNKTITCPEVLLESHRSKKDGLVYYVELESDIADNSELPTFYRLKCEEESDIKKLQDKCELRSGKKLKVKEKKLKP